MSELTSLRIYCDFRIVRKDRSTSGRLQGKNEQLIASGTSQEKVMNKDGKSLVVFFSHAGDNYAVGNIEECNTLSQQTGIEPILGEFGTKMMAWYPLGGQGTDGIVKNELLTTIGAKYNKTAAQVALRWLTQRGIVANNTFIYYDS